MVWACSGIIHHILWKILSSSANIASSYGLKGNSPNTLIINAVHSFFGYASALSWFAVHPVSMNNTNRMVSSDNLGYASYAFEQEKNIGFLPGQVKD